MYIIRVLNVIIIEKDLTAYGAWHLPGAIPLNNSCWKQHKLPDYRHTRLQVTGSGIIK
ncbi:hypothetical protein [Pedobacter sp. BS3]|uniref:hypothetical protein n=1 Tax=Pedobacter sp. BS3 TaxID=2567937 RepID=UPI00165948C0|nr:hypothetical protein [Pedobacter sp. BS3]